MAIVEAAKSGLNAVQNGRNYLDTLTNRYIVKPKTAKGIAGFVFDYEADSQVVMQAEITDHFVENNTAVQDHIALRPLKIVLRGFVGELVQLKTSGILGALNLLQNKLTTVPAYLGHYTPQALGKVQNALTQAQSTVNKIDRGLARVKNLVGLFDKAAQGPTKQAKAYSHLEGLYLSRQVFLVETPWKSFDNMVIENLAMIQDETTRFVTDVSVTLKQMRFVEVQTITANEETFGGRASQQRQGQTDKGRTKGLDKPISLLKEGVNAIFRRGQQ